MTKVSLIIPFYKNTKYLKEAVETLNNQSFKDLEIILVNDGGQLPAELKKTNLRILKQSHQGPAKARNLGASQAKGEILVFIDADMEFDKNFIKDLIKPIEEKKAKGVFSKNEYVANWSNSWARLWNYNFNLPDKKRLAEDYPDQSPVFRAILKSEFQRVGGFEPTGYADDWTLSKKLGYKADAVREAVYYHYNPESLNEVFSQAKWRVKRSYKLGLLGELLVLITSLLPFSLLIGIYKGIKFKESSFVFFKIVFDLGSTVGLLEKLILKQYY